MSLPFDTSLPGFRDPAGPTSVPGPVAAHLLKRVARALSIVEKSGAIFSVEVAAPMSFRLVVASNRGGEELIAWSAAAMFVLIHGWIVDERWHAPADLVEQWTGAAGLVEPPRQETITLESHGEW